MTECCNVKWGVEVKRCLHCDNPLKMYTSRDFEMKQMFDNETKQGDNQKQSEKV